MKNNRVLGCHVSAAGGVSRSFTRGVDIGCDTIQIFSKNQKQWKSKELAEEEVAKFRTERNETGIGPIVIHDSYLINLCSINSENLKKSRDSFADEIIRADLLGVEYLNFHPGAHQGNGEDRGIKKIAESINEMFERVPDFKVRLLLETTAGQGSSVGHTFEHLRQIIDLTEKPEKMGICVDTAHIFAAGYDIRTKKTYMNTFKMLDNIVGIDNVYAFHINDSKTDLGSHVDRHENIGEGKIGQKAFELLINDRRFFGKPMLLETPGGEESFKKNLNLLRSLIK
ncbi:deoxyribonuclease IV [candidate division KSB1 bacterium]